MPGCQIELSGTPPILVIDVKKEVYKYRNCDILFKFILFYINKNKNYIILLTNI